MTEIIQPLAFTIVYEWQTVYIKMRDTDNLTVLQAELGGAVASVGSAVMFTVEGAVGGEWLTINWVSN